MSKALAAENRKRRCDSEQHTFEIDIDHRFPVIDAKLVELRDRHNAGIADKDVELAVSFSGQCDKLRQVLATADVGHLGNCVAAGGREPRSHCIQTVWVARTQHQLGPAFSEQQRCCLANPTAGTGYRDYLAVNRHGPEATRADRS